MYADTTLAAAERFTARWRAEVSLLGLIAAAPRYRWPLAVRLGMTLADYTADDTAIIATALAVSHEHGRRITALLGMNLLIDAGLWDADDLRPFAGSSCWGPGALAALFTRADPLADESAAIRTALGELRRWPIIPPPTTTRNLRGECAE